jgi:putative ABC transport system permease protein
MGITGNMVEGIFYGLDRIDFPGAAYWRRDFAPASLGTLMNALGAEPSGILVPRSFLAQSGLKEGDTLQLTVSTDIKQAKMETRIVGSFNFFPTWYEEETGPLYVGNLDYLFEQVGGQSPYQVWVKTNPDIDYAQLGNIQLRDLNVRIVTWDAARPKIQQVQERPEQQGIFGFLFIGFAAAAVLTVVGLLLYALFSYQRRFIELGVLRAGGLSRGQMATYLAFELIFLIFFGGAIGTGLGVLISTYFIPYLQMGTEVAARTPPYKVIIAWPAIFQIYGLFGVLFGITLVVLIILLQRMKIFQAIKLGETV